MRGRPAAARGLLQLLPQVTLLPDPHQTDIRHAPIQAPPPSPMCAARRRCRPHITRGSAAARLAGRVLGPHVRGPAVAVPPPHPRYPARLAAAGRRVTTPLAGPRRRPPAGDGHAGGEPDAAPDSASSARASSASAANLHPRAGDSGRRGASVEPRARPAGALAARCAVPVSTAGCGHTSAGCVARGAGCARGVLPA